ncbi:MAG: thiamine phosphate synthase [Clostridiales Family XIII bacterium]|jgi:thiamine-phosphate pyrophosphorylase|nr:thiamine phosphate synthase [Clostridiales Family XIII bacterium]
MRSNEFKIYAVTNRRLCQDGFVQRVGRIAAAGADAIILREKDLCAEEYYTLASEIFIVCKRYETPFIANSFLNEAIRLGCSDVQLSFSDFMQHQAEAPSGSGGLRGLKIGVSVHSLAEAKEATSLGADRLIAGHIFKTDSKANLPPKGTEYLAEICRCVNIPVVGIGGIEDGNIARVKRTGAAGAAVMSSLMVCDDPAAYISRLRKAR